MLTPTAAAAAATRFGAVLGPRGLQRQPCLARGASCMYSSLAASLARPPCAASPVPRRLSTKSPRTSTSLQSRLVPRRHATTTTTTTTTATDAASSTPTPNPSAGSSPPPPPLDWNSFFQLRKTRRRLQVVSSLFTMAAGGAVGATVLFSVDMESMLGKVPMDPFFALGLMTMGFAGLGWLAGPSLGNAVFYAAKRGIKQPMAAKESEFFARIKKNRVDPSNSSLSGNAVPDFYGEKISSVAGYRQWLKDQRAFNKKRTSFV
ncbi:Pam17-domain-containing protein [Xylariaceae sp. FL0804]|nr:Pam17-domain-containing protein [Xylariaceae sp. FL0804]